MKKIISFFLTLALSLVGVTAHASDTPGQTGLTKVNIYDNTNDGWNVAVGAPDPTIGFVNFRSTVPGDLDHVKFMVNLKDGAPNCTYDIQLVTTGNSSGGGLAPDSGHSGTINIVGQLTTNKHGKGNTGSFSVDVTTLSTTAASGSETYGHIDIEAVGACTESDGTLVVNNEYGASGYDPSVGPVGAVTQSNIHWIQP